MLGNVQLVSEVSDTFLPRQVIENYHMLESKFEKRHKWKQISEQKIWEELCFCILSANVSYELARSVVDVTRKSGLLDYMWIKNDSESEHVLFQEFNRPNFKPVKNNGELRRYRYPSKRSYEIKIAANKIYKKNTLKEIFSKFNDALELRNFLASEISGLGIKESSHFLRNVGFSDSLAIIDIHVYRFLQELGVIPFTVKNPLTMHKYLLIESTMRNLSEYHGLNLAILDLAIWHYMRNRT